MQWGITCFFEKREDFEQVAEIAPRFPLTFLEIRGERPFFSPEDISENDLLFFQDIAKKSGLQVTLHATFYDINLSTVNSYLRAATLDCYKAYLDLASQLNARVMVIHAGYIHKDAANIPTLKKIARSNLIENLNILGDYATERNIFLGLENSPPNRNLLMVADSRNHVEILRQVNHPRVRACFDLAHAHLHGLDLKEYYDHIRDFLVEIHAHNNNGEEDQHLGMDRGVIDYKSFFLENRITVPVILEIRNLPEAMQSLEWIQSFEK